MRNGYLFLLLLFIGFQSKAQVDIPIGSGTTGNDNQSYPCPIQDWFEGARAQYLYQASELTAAGMGPGTISSIKFNVLDLNAAGLSEKMVIRIGGTAVATLSTNSWDDFTGTPVETTPV